MKYKKVVDDELKDILVKWQKAIWTDVIWQNEVFAEIKRLRNENRKLKEVVMKRRKQ